MRQWGVLCYAYEEVRRHMADRIESLVAGTAFDGVFLCLRSQARPADHADQFGFNDPVRADLLASTGKDILKEDFDLAAWRRQNGAYFTAFLGELRRRLAPSGKTLAVGVPRGDIIGPPLGNWELQWRDVGRHQPGGRAGGRPELLPMPLDVASALAHAPGLRVPAELHRRQGPDGPRRQEVRRTYAPAFAGHPARLFLARQWDPPDEAEEDVLRSLPGVSGLVFSTFRADNPEVIRRRAFYA